MMITVILPGAGAEGSTARGASAEAAGLATAAYLRLEGSADEAGAAAQSGQVCTPFQEPVLAFLVSMTACSGSCHTLLQFAHTQVIGRREIMQDIKSCVTSRRDGSLMCWGDWHLGLSVCTGPLPGT